MTRTANRQRRIAVAMGLEAAALAVMALLHLAGSLGGSLSSFSAPDAGLAEAVICIVLAYGANGLIRGKPRARAVAIAAASSRSPASSSASAKRSGVDNHSTLLTT